MRVAFDVTSILGARTGVGTFAAEILGRIARDDDFEVVGYSVSWRGRRDVEAALPSAVSVAHRPMAARPLRELWRRAEWPPIEWWTDTVDLVHGPNFVVPPTARGAAELVTVHDLTCVHHPELCTRDTLEYPHLIRRALRRGAHVHAVSRFVADEVIDAFDVDRDRVHVVPNGVTVRPGDPAAGRARARSDRYVLALGTIEPRKDMPSLIDAFDAVAASDHDVILVVAGRDGWGVDAYDAAVARARHRSRIVRLGWVDDQARADLIAGAAVFAYPSKYEGFGLPPLEAMAVGTPVVATAAGAIPEVLGDAALLVSPGDTDALAGALKAVLDDSAVRDRLEGAGREQAGRYSWDAAADGVAALYRRLC